MYYQRYLVILVVALFAVLYAYKRIADALKKRIEKRGPAERQHNQDQ